MDRKTRDLMIVSMVIGITLAFLVAGWLANHVTIYP